MAQIRSDKSATVSGRSAKVFKSCFLLSFSRKAGKNPWRPKYLAGTVGNFCHELATLPSTNAHAVGLLSIFYEGKKTYINFTSLGLDCSYFVNGQGDILLLNNTVLKIYGKHVNVQASVRFRTFFSYLNFKKLA